MSNLPISPRSLLRLAPSAVEWCGLRYVREITSSRTVRNDHPDANHTRHDEGLMVEVLVDGHFGHAATADLSPDGITRAFKKAVEVTRSTSRHKVFSFDRRQRPIAVGSFVSSYARSLDATSVAEITDVLLRGSRAMKIDERMVNRSAHAMIVKTQIELFSSDGTEAHQSFEMAEISLSATAAQGSESQTRSFAKTGQWGGEIFDPEIIEREALRTAREALELLTAENCPAEISDLILTPDQMMLQIHESIGHPLELDRILGDERNYAGWSFVKPEDFGRLQYGSPIMNVTFDPLRAHELASYAFDDGGTPATREFLIKDGILVRGLGSLESQSRLQVPGVANFRSASWNRAPIDRMANINLEPGSSSLEDMIGSVERGVLMKTNRSWSIDDYRRKFQFGCEYGQLIEGGRITRTVKNPNYRGITVDFWNRLAAVARDESSETHGTFYCGKGEPSQVIRVGHASPPCLFKDIEIFGGHA